MKKLGNPEIFDNDSECPETSWGQKFRNTRLVFRKKDGKLEFHTYGGDGRPEAFISQIRRADQAVGLDDFDYVRLYTTDNNPSYDMVESSPEPVLSQCYIDINAPCYSSHAYTQEQFHKDLIICPDFNFSKWLDFDYAKTYDKIISLNLNTNPIRKFFWRGRAKGGDNYLKRASLCALSLDHPQHIDAFHVQNRNDKNYVTLEDGFKNYKYMIDPSHKGFKGRLKYLMLSGRLIFLQCHIHKCFYEKEMHPWKHYIPLESDFSDLIEKFHWAESHPEECDEIINRTLSYAKKTFRINNINLLWRTILNGY